MTEPTNQPTDPKPTDPKPADPAASNPEALSKDLKDATSALDSERRQHARTQSELTKLRQSHMDDSEKAIAKARDEGKAEGVRSAGQRLAAAEFRARAAGKIGDASVLLDQMDLSKFVSDDGEPDVKRIDAVIEKLAESMPAAPAGPPAAPFVPAGPRPDPPDSDWLRQAMAGQG